MEGKSQARRVGTNLTEGSVVSGLVFFAIPIVLANVIQQLYSLVDLIVAGQYIGSVGIVGVSTGGELSDMLTPIATAFATAGQIIIAQLAGAKELKRIKQTNGTLISVMMLISFGFLLFTVLFRVQILNLLNCPSEAFYDAEMYMIITTAGMPFIFGYNAVCGVLRGLGESKRPLIFIMITAAVNIVLDLLLVIVFNMGVAGTAIATVFSQMISFLAAFIYMYQHRETFEFELKLSYFKIDSTSLRQLLKLGIPQALRSTLVRCSMLWVNAGVNAYGLVWSATNSAGNKLLKFIEVFSTGFAQASSGMVGQNLGARKYDRAKDTVWKTLLFCLVFAAISSVAALMWPKQIFGIFTQDIAVKELGVTYLRIIVIYFLLSAITSSFQSMVIGCGNASLNFVIGILDGVVCKIGLSLLFANVMGMGALGYVWGTSLSRALPGLLCFGYFISGKWKERKLLTET